MQIKSFDKQNLKALRIAIDSKLADVAKDFGLEDIKLGNIRFSDKNASAKIEMNTKGAKEKIEADDKEMSNFYLKRFGLEIGMLVKTKTQNLKIVGFNPRAHKSPVDLEDEKGRSFKGTIEQIKQYLVSK